MSDIESTGFDLFEEANTTRIMTPMDEPPSQVEESTENFLDGFDLKDLFTDEGKSGIKEEKIKNEITSYKWFYLKNKMNYSITLNKKEYYLKVKHDKEFVGNKFKEAIDSSNKVQLLTQIINERKEITFLVESIFQDELYIQTRKNKGVLKLFKTYIGGDEEKFFLDKKECVDFKKWKVLVHKNRLVYCCKM